MANIGYKGWRTLEEYNVETGEPTGNTKPNVEGDPDYVPPVHDEDSCPLPENSYIILSTTTINAGSEPFLYSINIESNISWTIVSEEPWIEINSDSTGTGDGGFFLNISNYYNIAERTGRVRVEGNGIVVYLEVNQSSNY